MKFEDEYPSGADIERERNYRERRLRERRLRDRARVSETCDSETSDSHDCEESDYNYDVSMYSLSEEEFREEEALLKEEEALLEKRARQIFMPDEAEKELPEILVYACKRVPRIKSYEWKNKTLVLINENGLAENRIKDFVNEDEKCVRQYFPFSYPEDYLEGSVNYMRYKVKASISLSMQYCEVLYYNPFDIHAQNSNRPAGIWDDCDFENDVDFRLVKSEIILKDSIQEALNDMDLESAAYVDIIMEIPESLDKYVAQYTYDILAYCKKNYPKIRVRISVNEFKPSNNLETCELRWKYLLFKKDKYLQSL